MEDKPITMVPMQLKKKLAEKLGRKKKKKHMNDRQYNRKMLEEVM